ncbi:hypothetical protein G6F65_022155 [Rhizopus arrhizus]|nr:hypothetical protein G6F65_022155 [Rhizopus arrhizus]
MRLVEDQLGAVARPARIRFVGALPKTRSGKVLRRAIVAILTPWNRSRSRCNEYQTRAERRRRQEDPRRGRSTRRAEQMGRDHFGGR